MRFSASGRPSSPAGSLGNASGSVFARRIFCAMLSASSERLMRELGEGSDLLILALPSRRLITLVAAPNMRGSGSTNASQS